MLSDNYEIPPDHIRSADIEVDRIRPYLETALSQHEPWLFDAITSWAMLEGDRAVGLRLLPPHEMFDAMDGELIQRLPRWLTNAYLAGYAHALADLNEERIVV